MQAAFASLTVSSAADGPVIDSLTSLQLGNVYEAVLGLLHPLALAHDSAAGDLSLCVCE